jgi:transcriptional regulator with GAF, ATPase, and Fis domain
LRDHPEDIPVLAWHFTRKYAREMRKQIDNIPSDTMRALVSWSWAGNVRELENFIERSVILSRGPNLRAPLSEIRQDAPESAGSSTMEQVEREHIIRMLRESGGVVSKAATRLGMPRTTLNAMMRRLGISRKYLWKSQRLLLAHHRLGQSQPSDICPGASGSTRSTGVSRLGIG